MRPEHETRLARCEANALQARKAWLAALRRMAERPNDDTRTEVRRTQLAMGACDADLRAEAEAVAEANAMGRPVLRLVAG